MQCDVGMVFLGRRERISMEEGDVGREDDVGAPFGQNVNIIVFKAKKTSSRLERHLFQGECILFLFGGCFIHEEIVCSIIYMGAVPQQVMLYRS